MTMVGGGQLYAVNGVPQDAAPRGMKVAAKYERASIASFGSGDWQS
jgi:hypothetical protein